MCGGAIHNEWQPCMFSQSSVFSLRVVVGAETAAIPTATHGSVNQVLAKTLDLTSVLHGFFCTSKAPFTLYGECGMCPFTPISY